MVTARTFRYPAALVAQHCRSKAAPVEEQNNLIICGQMVADAFDQRL